MICLGVNIDHVASLRQSRGTPYPSPIEAALRAESAGADSITLHLREDRRHIQDNDVEILRGCLKTRMNLESALTDEMLEFALRIKPHDVCLVPERRAELTTEGGLDVAGQFERVKRACAELGRAGIRVSLFVDADRAQLDAAKDAGATVAEIHTGHYADADTAGRLGDELKKIEDMASHGDSLGLRVHAGHGLNYHNVAPIAAITCIHELNIGHAIVAHALFVGWDSAVREMKSLMSASRTMRLPG